MILASWIIMAVIGYISIWISRLVVVRGTHPLEAIVVGVIIGALIRNLNLIPSRWKPYLKKFETPLLWGVVLLGAGFTIEIARAEPLSLIVILVTMSVGFWFVYLLGRSVGLPPKLSSLLSVGTTICGGTAIAITAPLIKAKEEETSYAVSVIVIAAFILLIGLPYCGRLLHMPEVAFGVWAGSAVHNTPQTIGTGYVYGETSGQVATMVKLTRNMFMILLAFLMAIWYHAQKTGERKLGKREMLKAFPWFLFGYVGIAVLKLLGFFTPEGIAYFVKAGKFLILMGMVGIGFGTNFRDMKRLGPKPLVVGILGAFVVTLVSLGMVKLLHFQ